MNSLWKQEFGQHIGIGRTRIRPHHGEGRRKLGKNSAEYQGTIQNCTTRKMQLKIEEEIKAQPQGSTCGRCISKTHSCADSTHTLAIRQPWLWTLAALVLWTHEVQSYRRCWGIFHTSIIIFFLIYDLFWSRFICPYFFSNNKSYIFSFILTGFFKNITLFLRGWSSTLLLLKRNLFYVKRIKESTNYFSQMVTVVPGLVYVGSSYNNHRLWRRLQY